MRLSRYFWLIPIIRCFLKVRKIRKPQIFMAIPTTVYDKTFEGENFRGFDSIANVFPRIFPSKFFSNNIASSCSLFLVVQTIALYKESFAHIVNSKPG